MFELIWRCCENLTYPKFYQAWQEGFLTNSTTQNIDLANLRQILAKEIDKNYDSWSEVKLICIDQ